MSERTNSDAAWATYQQDVADFFRGLGVSATVDESLRGVRTDHDIDVTVRFSQLGSPVLWVVECKLWQTRVTKLHVLALRTIVSDVGADRGIILAERGFQRGAIEAARSANIGLMSLAELKVLAEDAVIAAGLKELADRIDRCEVAYGSLPKEHRIRHGLRPEVGVAGPYSSMVVMRACRDAVSQGLRGRYPITSDPGTLHVYPDLAISAATPRSLVDQVEARVEELELRLRQAGADPDDVHAVGPTEPRG